MADTANASNIVPMIVQLLARVDYLERELAQIKTVLRQPKGAVARTAPDGTVAIRDPDIIAQQQRTRTRGYTPYSDTLSPEELAEIERQHGGPLDPDDYPEGVGPPPG